MTDRIKILFLGANPADISYRLRLEEEVREIEKRIQAGDARDSVELISRWAVTPSDLQALLLRHEPHIVHFSGHGTTKGIALENNLGNVTVVSKKALVNLFELFKEKVRVVLLNPSYSKPQAEAFRQSVDFTVGITKGTPDSAAIAFAAGFYQALAFGRSVTNAFELAEAEVELQALARWKRPELLIRKGVDTSTRLLPRAFPDTISRKSKQKTKGRPHISVGGDITDGLLILADNRTVQKRGGDQTTSGERESRGASTGTGKTSIRTGLLPMARGTKRSAAKKGDSSAITRRGAKEQNEGVSKKRIVVRKSNLQSSLQRVAKGEFTEADRELVRTALFNGQLQCVPDELNSTGKATEAIRTRDVSNAIIMQGAKANVTVELGESLLESIRERIFPKPRGIAPPFPTSIFVGREEALYDVKRLLGISRPGPTQNKLVIVRGWPGVGKTTLVGVIGRDTEVINAFPDGVLWAWLALKPNGGKPDLLSEMGRWGLALGTDQLVRARTLAEAADQLKHLLQDRKMLLILDEVGEAADAIPFLNAAGTDCVVLITTDQTSVAIELAPAQETIYVLPVLTEESALNLLRVISPDAMREYPDECGELARALEYLPLALQVAGRLINTEMELGLGLKRVLRDIKDGAAIINAKAPADRIDGGVQPTVQAILKKSTDLLDEYTRECFAFLGAFAPKPATFDLRALKAVWLVEDPMPIVNTLVGRGLLEPSGAGRYQMHALLISHARSLLV